MPFPALVAPAALRSVPRWAWIAIGAVLLLAALYFALDRFGDARYREGHADADREWQEASNRLIEKAWKAETKADANAAERAADFAAKQEDEKQRIEEAVEHGGSPLDVLFGEAE